MKTKKLNGKLSLNKKTIANLNKKEMKSVNGGTVYDWTEMWHCTVGCPQSEPQYFTCECSDRPMGCPTQ